MFLTSFASRAVVLTALLLALSIPLAHSEALDIPAPIIQPGYTPAVDARDDEKGFWMSMDEAVESLNRSPLVVRDGVLDEYVTNLACEIAEEYCADLKVFVIRNPYFNASMAPNGAMLVHTGLLVRAVSSDQVAAVLGHELAHYTQTHSIKRWRVLKNRMTVGALFSIALGATGTGGGGLPEILAMSSVMGYGRKQESEADLLGSYFMGRSGYDPAAAASIWLMLEEEEARASFKRPKGPLFLSSHPQPESRASVLSAVAGKLGRVPERSAPDPFVDVVQSSYEILMDEQVKHGDHGRLQVLLDRHEAMGIAATDVAFYRGESWRLRDGAGDHEKAMAAYQLAVSAEAPNPRAYRELGYLQYKYGEVEEARTNFRSFLELEPAASDREMIEFYLEDAW